MRAFTKGPGEEGDLMSSYSPPEWWSFAPFVLLLLAIAILPLISSVEHWWESNRNKLIVSLVLAAAMIAYYAFLHPVRGHEPGELLSGGHGVLKILKHAVVLDYVPFIVLLFSLYTISGGILLTGNIQARPSTNVTFLAVGTVLASFIGTTGAAMLLIRPILQTNAERKHKVHTVIFFIFCVANCGGSLTPLGDPPLFLGYLRGVPFWWTLHLVLPWLFINGILLVTYYIWDVRAYGRERPEDIALDETRLEPLSLLGKINFLWLLGVVACVAMIDPSRELPIIHVKPFHYARELALLSLALISWLTTPNNKELRERNQFNFTAIAEVACLFIGIFICMQSPVEFLQERGPELGLTTAPTLFWATGSLSSFLDNTPTYVVFFETGKAYTESVIASGANPGTLVSLGTQGAMSFPLLVAISIGAVFMGANTYIGNGPNFMVKSIAEQTGVKMPSFFGYMMYSMAILIPMFIITMFIFLW